MPVKSKIPDINIPNQSLPDLVLERIAHYGNNVALVDGDLDGKSVTFKKVREQILSCAGFLRKQGLKKGDVVGLCAPTCIEFPIAMLGIMATGSAVAPFNPSFTKGEISRLFTITEPKMVFVHESAVDIMKEAVQELTCIKEIFVIGKSEEFTTFESIIRQHSEQDIPQDVHFNPSEELAFLPYSSGTTGMPKSVMLTHRNMVSMTLIWKAVFESDEISCYYTDRPMFHIVGCLIATMNLVMGIKLITRKEYKLEKMLACIDKYKATRFFATPAVIIEMINAECSGKYDTTSLKEIQYGGAPLPPSAAIDLVRRYKVRLIPTYGMTEFPLISFNNDGDPESAGLVPPNTMVKIVDLQTGGEVGVNKDGEILATGPQLMKGYLKNPESTEQTIDNEGWIHTGDIGHFDDHGMLYVIDRLKEVIKYKSIQVSPTELEGVISSHPKVADVGVIGIPDPLEVEVPKAFVVKKDGSLTKEEVLQLVKSQLADYKQIRGGVEFIKEIPKSKTGKILRGELKKMANVKSYV